jgi:hypothetical protein
LDTLAQLTYDKPIRDPLGRYLARNRTSTTTTTQPTDDPETLPLESTRASSRLSGNYDFADPTTKPNTPYPTTPPDCSPVNLSLKLSPVSLSHKLTPPPQPKPTVEIEEMAETVTAFQGDVDDENPEDFLRAFFRRMGNNSDETKLAQFPYYLQADGAADEWFDDLADEEKETWASLVTAFQKRWPRKTQAKKTDEEYEDDIMGRKLKTEDLGKKEKVAGRDVYTHIAWADKMGITVKGAGLEKTTTYLRQVRKDLPVILREKVGTGHKNWKVFLSDVRDVEIDHIRDSMDRWNKEQANQKAIDHRIRMLEALTRSPTAPLRQQLSTVAISNQPRTAVVGDPFTNASGGQGNLRFPATTVAPRPTKPPFTSTNPRPPPTLEQKAELRALMNTLPHHPDTQAGRQAHQAQQNEWVRLHGYGTRVTEKTPYPLRPGTAPVNSGECFTCGNLGHLGARTGDDCKALGYKPLHPSEQQWRAICTRVLKEPRLATNVHYVAIDDYGTTLQDIQGNGEGPST